MQFLSIQVTIRLGDLTVLSKKRTRFRPHLWRGIPGLRIPQHSKTRTTRILDAIALKPSPAENVCSPPKPTWLGVNELAVHSKYQRMSLQPGGLLIERILECVFKSYHVSILGIPGAPVKVAVSASTSATKSPASVKPSPIAPLLMESGIST